MPADFEVPELDEEGSETPPHLPPCAAVWAFYAGLAALTWQIWSLAHPSAPLLLLSASAAAVIYAWCYTRYFRPHWRQLRQQGRVIAARERERTFSGLSLIPAIFWISLWVVAIPPGRW